MSRYASAGEGRWSSGHKAWAFSRRAQFEAGVTSFLAEGAALGERLVLATDEPRPSQWPDALLKGGQLLLLSTDAWYGDHQVVDASRQREAFLAMLEEARRLGHAGLRFAADNTSLVSGPERLAAWVAWEAEADALMAVHPITGLCAFDRSRLDDESFEQVMAIHAVRPFVRASRLA